MTPSEIEPALPEPSGSLALSRADEPDRRFANLRGVRWRVNLGVLPSFASSIDEFRRATANSRRRNGDSNQNLMKTLKNLGQTMLKHIQAIELVFQQERGSVQAGLIGNLAKTSFIEKGTRHSYNST